MHERKAFGKDVLHFVGVLGQSSSNALGTKPFQAKLVPVFSLLLGNEDEVTNIELRRVNVGLLVVPFDSFFAAASSSFRDVTMHRVQDS